MAAVAQVLTAGFPPSFLLLSYLIHANQLFSELGWVNGIEAPIQFQDEMEIGS